MRNYYYRLGIISTILCFIAVLTYPATTVRADATGITGWEKDSTYNSYYDYKERDAIKGKVVKFQEIVPLPGMAPGTAFILDEDGQEILVHLCPVTYADAQKTGIRKDIKTKVAGAWATIEGKDVFMAAKVKQGENFEFKVRLTKDGTPFWTMSPEELAKEASSQ